MDKVSAPPKRPEIPAEDGQKPGHKDTKRDTSPEPRESESLVERPLFFLLGGIYD